MFAVKRNAVISFNLYCGGGPALPPAAPGAEPAPPPPASAAQPPRALDGAGRRRWAAAGPPGAPRSPGGCGAAAPAARWSPEQELDGCEPDCDRGPGGGSLPSTPPGPPDELWQDSLELIGRYLREAAGEAEPSAKKLFPGLLCGPGRPRANDAVMEKALETLRRVGDGILQKHELAFQGMLRRLEVRGEAELRAVREVAAQMFGDGVTNWGRVVTLLSFGAFLARHLKSIRQEQSVGSLAAILTEALVSDRREWLLSQGGWEGFVDFFRVEDMEGSVRKMLMALAGVAGVGASLAYMIR
ncbi:induced myeloid leukemia cell differentiation protein Mcl-1 [Dryobates pubescens]|uniref:induced myeloid leukemia cell differentiation protein Mcl-1 n=1 Tax=Dryobates pubescens TaxID=118200 RepID=UPI0023B8C716|nr:induced myeloid leukemia cell differentiation protein Mcl-1 [Dryobates pubescens]